MARLPLGVQQLVGESVDDAVRCPYRGARTECPHKDCPEHSGGSPDEPGKDELEPLPDWRTTCIWQHTQFGKHTERWQQLAREDEEFRVACVFAHLQRDPAFCHEAASFGVDLMEIFRQVDPSGMEGRWTRGALGRPLRIISFNPYIGIVTVHAWSADPARRGETTMPVVTWVQIHINSPKFLPEDFEPSGVTPIPRHGYSNRPGSCSGVCDGPPSVLRKS